MDSTRIKKIEAIIQSHKLDDVREALKEIGLDGMTLSEVLGHGQQRGHTEMYRGVEYEVDLLPKTKLEIVIGEDRLEELIDTLIRAARTGSIGDGKIFVSDISEVIRIRNYDRGEGAL